MLSQVPASSQQAAKSALLGRKIDETAAGLQASIAKQLRLINEDNAAIIVEYVGALKHEVNLADATKLEQLSF